MADDLDGAFATYAAATLDGLLARQPEWATGVGDHKHLQKTRHCAGGERPAGSFAVHRMSRRTGQFGVSGTGGFWRRSAMN